MDAVGVVFGCEATNEDVAAHLGRRSLGHLGRLQTADRPKRPDSQEFGSQFDLCKHTLSLYVSSKMILDAGHELPKRPPHSVTNCRIRSNIDGLGNLKHPLSGHYLPESAATNCPLAHPD